MLEVQLRVGIWGRSQTNDVSLKDKGGKGEGGKPIPAVYLLVGMYMMVLMCTDVYYAVLYFMQ